MDTAIAADALACLRSSATKCPAGQASERGPGRAAGEVLAWSFARTVSVLQRFGRLPLKLGTRSQQPTAQETTLLTILGDLVAGREDMAELRAQWLVPKQRQAVLLRALKPAADILRDQEI
ncbi:MAG: hypothetical protein AAF486_03435 [Pseudomonadota bacterium]